MPWGHDRFNLEADDSGVSSIWALAHIQTADFNRSPQVADSG